MPDHIRQVLLPGITVTVRNMLDALREVGGEQAVRLVKREQASPEVAAILGSWPVRFDVSKALKLGFKPDQPYLNTVRDFAKSLDS